jgi:hypothetical protein
MLETCKVKKHLHFLLKQASQKNQLESLAET